MDGIRSEAVPDKLIYFEFIGPGVMDIYTLVTLGKILRAVFSQAETAPTGKNALYTHFFMSDESARDEKPGELELWEVMGMRIGIIGAGKVGFTLGKYFVTQDSENTQVIGYYSRRLESAKEAATFTETRYYENLADIVKDSDTLFITASDGAIADVWDDMAMLPIKEKLICHCSGSISSAVFFDAESRGAYRYSVHPLYAVSDKYTSYQTLQNAYFAIEGSQEHLEDMVSLFRSLGNPVVAIDPTKKTLYHAAAVMVSNQVAALVDMGAELLQSCGFTRKEAEEALSPLFVGNAQNIGNVGPVTALTGPIERGDAQTVRNHLKSLDAVCLYEISQVYMTLSQRLVEIAKKKHPNRNYEQLEKELQK